MKLGYILTAVCTILYGWMFFHFEKWNAEWWGINIVALAIPCSVIITFSMVALFKYFLEDFFFQPIGYAILALGLMLSVLGGVYMTEPTQKRGWTEDKPYAEGYQHSRVGTWYYHSTYFVADSGGSSSCNDCGEGLVYLFLALLVVVLVLLSCTLPHFWVIGGLSMLMMLLYFTINNEEHEAFY